MRQVDYSEFSWKRNKLYLDDILWGEILPHEKHPKMWIIRWEGNGEFSTDFWNRTRAKDNFIKMAQFLYNMAATITQKEVKVAPRTGST